MSKLSLKGKLGVGFGTLLLVLLAMAMVGYRSLNKLSNLSAHTNNGLKKSELSTVVDDGYEMESNGTRGYLATGNDLYLEHRREGAAQAKQNLPALQKLLETDQEKTIFGGIVQQSAELEKIQDEVVADRKAGKNQAASDLLYGKDAKRLRENLDHLGEELESVTEKLEQDALQAQEKARSDAQNLMVGLGLVGGFIGIAVALAIARSILVTIGCMAALIQQIAANDLAVEDIEIASRDEVGKAGAALNSMKNCLRATLQSITDVTAQVASASEELSVTGHQISAHSEETSTQATVVAAASEQVSSNVNVMATGSEEMLASIREIAKNSSEAARVAKSAMSVAVTTNQTITRLGDSSMEIGEVIKVITSIAQQTNLLALNATIEAARAGEAGKGFAVVANEVKELAKETAKATQDIGRKIEAIQGDTKGAVQAIEEISGVINQINDISNTIASAVEEQTATTNEMGRNITEAAKGASEIARNIAGVAQAAKDTSTEASHTNTASTELARMAAHMHSLMQQFKLGQRDSDAASNAARAVPALETRAQRAMAARA